MDDSSQCHLAPAFGAVTCSASDCLIVFSEKEKRVHCERCGNLYCAEHCANFLSLRGDTTKQAQLNRICDDCCSDRKEDNTLLEITVIGATGLHSRSVGSEVDPYVVVRLGLCSLYTSTVKNNTSPTWNETVTFPFPQDDDDGTIQVTVIDESCFLPEDSDLGMCEYDPQSLVSNQTKNLNLTIADGAKVQLSVTTYEEPPIGRVRDLTAAFVAKRDVNVANFNQQCRRVQENLQKLSIPPVTDPTADLLKICHLLIPWESNEDVTECRVCKGQFGWIKWKHHCRLCGRLVCGDCGNHFIPLSRTKSNPNAPTEAAGTVRTCNTCYDVIEKLEDQAEFKNDIFGAIHKDTVLYSLLIVNHRDTLLESMNDFKEKISKLQTCPEEGFPQLHQQCLSAGVAVDALLKAYEVELLKLKGAEAMHEKERRVNTQMVASYAIVLQEMLQFSRQLRKHVDKIANWKTMDKNEWSTFKNGCLLITRLSEEKKKYADVHALYGEAFEAAVQKMQYELQEATYVIGKDPDAHISEIESEVKRWEKSHKPLIKVKPDLEAHSCYIAVLQRSVHILSKTFQKLDVQISTGVYLWPLSRLALLQLTTKLEAELKAHQPS
eukprot:GFYU01008629.1.p1 GENE.GFYU01008629.1~~GFYU01008629.1.p1  ORF type:complete len:607 (-),score=170.79 GFYU01008629.1:52-1872(-)